MTRRYNLVGLGLMGVAVVLALFQWVVATQTSTLPSFVEFFQSWVLITAAALWVGYLAIPRSTGVASFIRTFFASRASLPLPGIILAYLSTTWFAGFYEKHDVAAWHNGLALKGFWLGTIAQSHPGPTNPFPNVHYSFWVNLLQWNLDHSVYTWFGYVVMGAEIFVAVAFITTILAVFYRPVVFVAIAGGMVALLFHFFFLMSGSAGVNALMPYLTGLATVMLVSIAVAPKATEQVLVEDAPRPLNSIRDTVIVAQNGATTEDRTPVLTK